MNKEEYSPEYSYWPIALAFSVLCMAVGVVSNIMISLLGLLLLMASIGGWVWENREGGVNDHE